MRENKGDYAILATCPFCGNLNVVTVNEDDFWNWQNGTLIQDAFPYLTADEREIIKTGICPKCWDSMFSEEEEEEEEEEDYEPDWDLDMGFDPYMGCYTDDC